MGRNLGTAALLFVAMVLQVTVLNRLGFAVVPDLVLLLVIALAAARGAAAGAVIGFLTGLAADVLPPADHVLGQYGLVMCLIGYVAGRGAVRAPMLTVMTCAVCAPALAVGVGALLGDPGVDWGAFEAVWPGTALCNLVVAPFLVWGVNALFRVPRRPRKKALVLGGRRP
ncbi:rod shape-determining protein MreD [Acrocarpospora catenulata]|uniref:rod shape-determining protein MreD n=1 Tax=Acrocarpospora catenulata TaxID=2836182 RepID=UPI002023AD50|nr:rod shape-determining protein MreD [Acrocarpospora catenulata]